MSSSPKLLCSLNVLMLMVTILHCAPTTEKPNLSILLTAHNEDLDHDPVNEITSEVKETEIIVKPESAPEQEEHDLVNKLDGHESINDMTPESEKSGTDDKAEPAEEDHKLALPAEEFGHDHVNEVVTSPEEELTVWKTPKTTTEPEEVISSTTPKILCIKVCETTGRCPVPGKYPSNGGCRPPTL